jgi:uncharacterized protein (DUF1697 family)
MMKTNRYIALLRGINVSGHNIIRMEALRDCFAGLGCRNVQTYLQSGNVIFEPGRQEAAPGGQDISSKIRRDFGFPVPVILRTAEELERIVHQNPFLKKPAVDHTKLHVTFLSTSAPKSAGADLEALATAPEQFHVYDREIYLYCPNGYGRTKLSNNAIEAKIRVAATTRNWKSVQALLALAHS